MTEWFLKLLGAHSEGALDVADASVAFRAGLGSGWFVFGLLILGGLAWWFYLRSPVTLSRPRKYTLLALRLLFLVLVLGLLLRPVLALTVEGTIRRLLVVLVDGSASMKIQDPRLTPDDQKRAALAKGLLAPQDGLSQSLPASRAGEVRQVSRLALVRDTLTNEQLNLLPRLQKEFDVAPFVFGQGLHEMVAPRPAAKKPSEPEPKDRHRPLSEEYPWVNDLEADSPLTAMGDALHELLNRKRGQPLAGVLLVTDGANNSGNPPLEAASLLKQEHLPLYVYGVGITSPRDIIVGSLFAPDVSFVKDEVSVNVRVRSQGLAGDSARLVLSLGGEKVAEKEVSFAGDGEQVVPMNFTPRKEGDFELEASIPARADEAVADNNSRRQHLRVIDARIKVLLVDQAPRWEFRYLQAMLLRDRRVDLKCYLVEGDPAIARAQNSPYLAEFPRQKEDLFRYDLVIFGDVDPKALTPAQFENLNELVSRFGGALVVVAGKRFLPGSYRHSMLENMLPVELENPTLETANEVSAERPIQLEMTAAGKASPMLRLSDRPDENVRLWRQLPPIYWVAKVARPKPAAEVLLVDPDPLQETRFGRMPVVAFQQYGLGQVMFVGTDNTWRWRKNVGDVYYTALWGQVAQRMSLPRLMGSSKRTQLSTDRHNYVTGERVTIFARLYSLGYEPVQDPVVKGTYELKAGDRKSEVTLRSIPEQPGLYRAEFVAPAPGSYRFFVQRDPETPLDFSVTEPQFELGETAMNAGLLKDMARGSGGAFFREEDLYRLPDVINRQTERVRSPLEVELWSSPLYFLLILGVLTSEWVLRKRSNLK